MAIREKKIRGKKYLYAEHSFRLPNNAIKKVSKLIKKADETYSDEVKRYFTLQEKKAYINYAFGVYKTDTIFTKELIETVENMRVEYKHVKNALTKKQFNDVIDRFTVNFTYESNAIEGNSLTLKDVTLILSENIVPKNKDLREVYETKNTRIANKLLFGNKIKITRDSIIKLHKILVKDTGVAAGYKKIPNYLLMRNVKTTPPEKVESEMAELIDWYARNNNENIHPLRLATEFHARFEKIHPFEDGNGRVGRLLLNAILIDNGLFPLIIRKTMRVSYFSALEAFDSGHKERFERFVIEKFKKTFKQFFQVYFNYL